MSTLRLTLGEVRDLLGGGEIVGDAGFFCQSVASLGRAGQNQLSFVKDLSRMEEASASQAGAFLVPEALSGLHAHQLVVNQPFMAFGIILRHIAGEKRRQAGGVHPTAVVAEGAKLGTDVTIGAGAVIREETRIGDRAVIYANVYIGQRSVVGGDSVLHPNVVIMEDVTLGERVVVHGGTVIGTDGYGYIQNDGQHIKIPQVGAIDIGDDVEIGALATIDRATLDTTVIGRGTKIGDLVHVGHNCEVGEDVLLLPTVAVSGSVRIGDRALLAGRAGTADNITIGEGAVLGGTCVAFKDVEPGAFMWGNPARERMQEMRIQSALTALPTMKRELAKLRKKVE